MDLRRFKVGDKVVIINAQKHWSADFLRAAKERNPIVLYQPCSYGPTGWYMLGSWMSEDHLVKYDKPKIVILSEE